MSDNARFHNKLHRKNHHTSPTTGYPDSATDPIASAVEPFQGDFYLNGNLSVTGAINTTFQTLSNISLPTPVLSATVGFNPTNSLIIQLSGVKYAIPVTYVGNNSAPVVITNALSGVTTFSNGVSILGSISGVDSINWNAVYTAVVANSASWYGGQTSYATVNSLSAEWSNAYTTVNANSANWQSSSTVSAFVIANSATSTYGFNSTVFAKTSAQAYTLTSLSSIQANTIGNNASGNFAGVLAGSYNTASGYGSVIVGGGSNTVSGRYSTILGGTSNTLSGNNSFALGSNLASNVPNYTFVNNLSSQGSVQTSSAYSGFLSISPNNSSPVLANSSAQFLSNTNCYSQINVQNVNSGSCASADVVITADNGTNTTNYLDLGINSSTYAVSAYGITGPDDAYLYTQSKNLAIGTAANANILFHTGGTLASNERVRITSSGYVGIGTCSPNATLTVVGNISASGNVCSSNAVYVFGSSQGSIQTIRGSNTVSNVYAYIGGGCCNQATGVGAVVGGGYSNRAVCDNGVVLGGCCNTANGAGSTVVGGVCNNTASNYSGILAGCKNIACCYGVVGGGTCNSTLSSFSFIGSGACNTSSGAYNIIVGGYKNINNGQSSFIAGGCCNCISSGINNAFVLGSNINATCSGYTYVNGIITPGSICADTINATNLYSNGSFCAYNLSGFCASIYNAAICDFSVLRNSVMCCGMTVYGTISSQNFTCLAGNKYSTTLGNGALSSFTVTHNLSTNNIITTVTDTCNQQVVYPSVCVPNSTQVQISFSFVPPASRYNLSVIGF